MNWDALARQDRLRKWIRDNSPFISEDERLKLDAANAYDQELSRWAKAAVRKVISRAKTREKLNDEYKLTSEGKLDLALELLEIAVEEENIEKANEAIKIILNVSQNLPISAISEQKRKSIKELVEISQILASQD
jgi:hypothetical protein